MVNSGVSLLLIWPSPIATHRPHGAIVMRARLRARRGEPSAIAARMAEIRATREASQPCVRARRFHFPQSARHEGVGVDRDGRVPWPDAAVRKYRRSTAIS